MAKKLPEQVRLSEPVCQRWYYCIVPVCIYCMCLCAHILAVCFLYVCLCVRGCVCTETVQHVHECVCLCFCMWIDRVADNSKANPQRS